MDIKDLLQNKIFTVTEFNNFANSILAPLYVTVEGEVSDFRISQNQYVWFALKDAEQNLSCFSLLFRLHQPVEDGMKVRVTGYPKIYGKSGRFSFVVEKLELSGEGSINKAFLLLKQKLEREGLFDPSRKRSLPPLPQTIGLITSPQAAAYADFIKQLNLRLGGLRVVFIPVAVQGESMVNDVVNAFKYFNAMPNRPDVVVLTRGGGSLEDLQFFDSEKVVRAVFGSAAPVVCAIGHERDVCLSELAADVRASTPTHAAQLVVPDKQELRGRIFQMTALWTNLVDNKMLLHKHQLELATGKLGERVAVRIHANRAFLEKFYAAFTFLEAVNKNFRQKLAAQNSLLRSLNPKNVLARGYSIVKKHGKIIRMTEEVTIGDNLSIILSEGRLESEVKRIINPKSKLQTSNQ